MSSRAETAVTTGVSKAEPSRAALALSFLSTWVIWGSTYLAIRYAVETIPPLVTAGLRHLTAGSVLFAYSYFRGFRPTAKHWRGALLIGAFYFLGGHGTLHWAEQRVSSGLAAVLIATEPLFISAIQVTTGKERFSFWTLLGMTCGIGAVAYLMGGQGLHAPGQMLGIVMVLVGSLSWGIGVCISPGAGLPEDPFASAGMTMFCGSFLLLATAAGTGEFAAFHPQQVAMRSWLGLLFLIVFGSIVAFSAYVWLLGQVSPTIVSTHTFVNPVVAVLLGWGLAGEVVSTRLVAAMLSVLVAIWFIRRGTRRASV